MKCLEIGLLKNKLQLINVFAIVYCVSGILDILAFLVSKSFPFGTFIIVGCLVIIGIYLFNNIIGNYMNILSIVPFIITVFMFSPLTLKPEETYAIWFFIILGMLTQLGFYMRLSNFRKREDEKDDIRFNLLQHNSKYLTRDFFILMISGIVALFLFVTTRNDLSGLAIVVASVLIVTQRIIPRELRHLNEVSLLKEVPTMYRVTSALPVCSLVLCYFALVSHPISYYLVWASTLLGMSTYLNIHHRIRKIGDEE